jgi:hypothetical protein
MTGEPHDAKLGPVDSAPEAYTGSSFSEVRSQLLSDPYTILPHHIVTIGSMFKAGKNLLKQDGFSLVDRDADLVPPMQKLLHGVGIILFGKWKITEETGYTGGFRKGVEYLIVVRCSTLLSRTDRGKRRGFGLAGKIFPTLDPGEVVRTANFITIDHLGGTFANHFTDVALTNQPPIGINLSLISFAFVLANIVYVFKRADTTPDLRPLTELAEAGLAPGETPKAPKWMQITAADGIGKSDAVDFRDELRVTNYKDRRLCFSIAVASEKSAAGERLFHRIGAIELTEDVCSFSGDHRIRFRHFPNRGHAPA